MAIEFEDDDAALLTTEDVMRILLADSELRRRAVTCVLPAVRSGNDTRFRKRDLDEWINRQREGTRSPTL